MTRILKFIFLFTGLGLLAWSIKSVDTARVFELLLNMGYGFIFVLLVFVLVNYLDTIAWHYNFKPEQAFRFNYLQLWKIRLIGEAYNTITPLGTMGGEPVKAQLLKDHYGLTFKQGLASLVITRTTMLTGLITFFIPGIILIFQSEIISEELKYISLTGMVVFTILIFLFFLFQVTGMLGILASWASRVFPGLSGHGSLEQLKTLDGLMSTFYREYPDRTIKSIFYAFAGWVVGLGELYFTLYFLGYDPTLTELWIIESSLQLIKVGSFYIPMSLGAQEGGLIVIFIALGLTGDLGLAVSFVRRIKDLIWVSAGLLLGWSLAFKPATKAQADASEG
jgi:glycosyltransferase 2 family protein